MNRRIVAGTRIGLVLLATGALLQGGPADAAPPQAAAPTLAGIQGSAGASGVHVLYNPAGILPIAPPVDLGVPDALATIASGPSTFARASAADPGDLLANPDALIQQSGQEPGTLPAYPYRASASNGVGEPTAENSPAPGLDARVAADDTGSSALATMPAFTGPSILTTGSASSTATTSTDGNTLTVHAVSSISDVDVLGVLTIDSVVTDLTAVTDGTTATVTGGTVVTGASAGGQPVTIDGNGIQGLPAALVPVFENLGMQVTVVNAVPQGDGGSGQLTSVGLRIDFELSETTFPVLGTVFDAIPGLPPLAPGAPSADDVLAVAQARHLTSVHLAGASVSVAARLPTPRPTPTPAAPSAPSAPVATPSAPVASPTRPASVPVGTPTAALAPAAPAASVVPDAGPIDLAQGIGVLAALALLVQPFLGDRLARTAALMTTAEPAEHCPREGA